MALSEDLHQHDLKHLYQLSYKGAHNIESHHQRDWNDIQSEICAISIAHFDYA